MQFSENEIERFAAWSGDHNPFHIDPEVAEGAGFQQPVVHGILAAFGALGSVYPRAAEPLTTLEIDFRAPVLPNVVCDVGWARGPAEFSATIRQGGREAVTIGGEFGNAGGPRVKPDLAWLCALDDACQTQERGKRLDPADRDLDEFQSGLEVSGVYATDPAPEAATASGYLTPLQARVLGLCSYLTGMELPGLRSLFLRARLRFHNVAADSNQLWYRLRTNSFDPGTRTLETSLEIAAPDGQLLATGTLQSYVRFTPVNTDLEALVPQLPAAGSRLTGKIALVCGGSRGLGADLTAALALAGCHVYAGCRSASASARKQGQRLAEHDAPVEFLKGDAGDPTWCARALEIIHARHGRLDVLALNACAFPAEFPIRAGSVAQFDEYLRANLRLASTPLATFLPLLEESGGVVACISSSLVTNPQPGYAHHVALKQAVEGLVQTATRESSNLWTLIVRPPRLQTSWNDTPARVAGAIPASAVACSIVNRLAGEWRPGQVELLAERYSIVAPALASHSAPRDVQSPVVGDPVFGDFEDSDTAFDFADAADFESLETADLDADAILVSIDALIAAKLAPPPALTDDSDQLLPLAGERRAMPDLAEIDHWHEACGRPAGDSSVACPVISAESAATVQPAVAQLPDNLESARQITAEQQLFDFLSEMQSEVEEAVGFRDDGENHVEEDLFDDESVLFQEQVQLPETQSTLDVFDTTVPPETTAAGDSDVIADFLAPGDIAAAPDSAVAASPAESRVESESHDTEDGASARAKARADEPAGDCAAAAMPVALLECASSAEAGPSPAEPVTYEITGYAPQVEQDIFHFEQRAWPGRQPTRVVPRWNWLHVGSAGRLAVEPQVWQYREEGQVVAHAGAVPIKLRIDGDERLAAWIVATLPPEGGRSEAAGARLMVRAADSVPFSLSHGRTEQSRQLLASLGWVEVLQLETAELMIHPDAVLQGKHPGTATLSDWGWRAATAVRTLFHHRARLDVQQVARFEERHDRLWHFASRDIVCGVVRDASYLNWRYVDQPADDILRLEVVDGNALRGVVVLLFRDANEAHPYRHAILADLVAPLCDDELLAQMFQVASAAAAERDADALLCEHAGASLTRALRQNGFLMREPGRFLFVQPGQLPLESRSKALAGKDWLMMPGDVEFGD